MGPSELRFSFSSCCWPEKRVSSPGKSVRSSGSTLRDSVEMTGRDEATPAASSADTVTVRRPSSRVISVGDRPRLTSAT